MRSVAAGSGQRMEMEIDPIEFLELKAGCRPDQPETLFHLAALFPRLARAVHRGHFVLNAQPAGTSLTAVWRRSSSPRNRPGRLGASRVNSLGRHEAFMLSLDTHPRQPERMMGPYQQILATRAK